MRSQRLPVCTLLLLASLVACTDQQSAAPDTSNVVLAVDGDVPFVHQGGNDLSTGGQAFVNDFPLAQQLLGGTYSPPSELRGVTGGHRAAHREGQAVTTTIDPTGFTFTDSGGASGSATELPAEFADLEARLLDHEKSGKSDCPVTQARDNSGNCLDFPTPVPTATTVPAADTPTPTPTPTPDVSPTPDVKPTVAPM